MTSPLQVRGGFPTTFTSLTVTGLVDISAAGAGQIKFPATQNASADANTLDDYEEGTWTPADGSGAGLSLTLSGTQTYTKIGREIAIILDITYPVTVDGTGAVISGFPFTCNANTFGVLPSAFNSTATYIGCSVSKNTTTCIPYTTGGTQKTNASLSTLRFICKGLYHV